MDALRRQGLAGLTAWVLEAAGPLNLLGAQLLYIGQPFLPASGGNGLRALAQMLEQDEEVRAFTALLKGKQQ